MKTLGLARRVRTFLFLPWSRKRMLVEGATALVLAWWQVRYRQFRCYSANLGVAYDGEFIDPSNIDAPRQTLIEVRWVLRALNRMAKGKFTCLMLAMAGKRMLNRRGFANTLVLGVRPGKGQGDDPFGAHAWLRAGQYVVIGQEERAGHIPVASYHSAPRI